MIKNLNGNFEFRYEIFIFVKHCANLEFQEQIWLEDNGYFEVVFESFINDYDYDSLQNCLDEINVIFYDDDEAKSVWLFYNQIFKIYKEIQSNNFRNFYNHPKWPTIIKLAKYIYELMKVNSRKYSINNFRGFIVNNNIVELRDTEKWMLNDIFFDDNEKLTAIKIGELIDKLSDTKNNHENFYASPSYLELIELVKKIVLIFADNNKKYCFEQTIQEISKHTEEIKQLELQEKYLEFRVKAAELLWKKFINWHRYRRKRPSFNKT
jgi:hypothetical protein